MCQRGENRKRDRARCQPRERKRVNRVGHEMIEVGACCGRRDSGSRRVHRSKEGKGKEQEEEGVPRAEEKGLPNCLSMLTGRLGSSTIVKVYGSRRKAEMESE